MPMLDIASKINSPIPGSVTVLVDGKVLLRDAALNQDLRLAFAHDCTRQIHEFELRLSGKRTWLDGLQGYALDQAIQQGYYLDYLRFDGVNVYPLIHQQGGYWHDYNGFGDITRDSVDRDMGCDGSLKFRFVTPMASWMIESFPHGCSN